MNTTIFAACAALAMCAVNTRQVVETQAVETASSVSEWRIALASPGGELPFTLSLHTRAGELSATVHNGSESIAIGEVTHEGDNWTLRLDPYDSFLRFQMSADGASLTGRWEKSLGGERKASLALKGARGRLPRFDLKATNAEQRSKLDGRWAVQFASDEALAVGHFESFADGRAVGTFETTLGDYRFLAGSFDGELLRLSCFDGGHAFLFHSRLNAEGELTGDFWSRDSWHETWTARKDANAALPDSFGLTRWTGAVPLAELKFPGLDGRVRSLADKEFAGRARIITLFGTWCPNCNDEAQFLGDLHRRYAARGLSILGLAFELDDDHERSRKQVERFSARHKVTYPVLIAGTADKEKASQAFPALDRVRAFPTALVLDEKNEVVAIHTGFSGPATGAAHEHMKERYEVLIEGLLSKQPK